MDDSQNNVSKKTIDISEEHNCMYYSNYSTGNMVKAHSNCSSQRGGERKTRLEFPAVRSSFPERGSHRGTQ